MVKVKGSDKTEPTATKPATKSAGKPAAAAKSAAKPAAKAAPKTAVKSVAKTIKLTPKTAAPTKEAAVASKEAAVAAPVATLVPAPVPAEQAAAEPKIVTSSTPVVTGPEMKKKELIDKVVKRAGVKKKDAKLVVDAMLAVLGEALAEGRELVLQPMGRLKTTRVKEAGNGRVLICRLRQGGAEGKGGKETLAEDDD